MEAYIGGSIYPEYSLASTLLIFSAIDGKDWGRRENRPPAGIQRQNKVSTEAEGEKKLKGEKAENKNPLQKPNFSSSIKNPIEWDDKK